VGSLIDTSILIASERGKLDLGAILDELAGAGPVAIAAITGAELLEGVHRADVVRRATRSVAVEHVLARFPTIPFDLAIARRYALLMAERALIGRPVHAHDLMIAATALELDYQVVSRDARSFPDIAGLKVVMR
jgi:predicted nucleic acid-binding protein